MEILKGLPVANSINEQLIEDIKNIDGELPHLAIIRVGERPDDCSYERGAVKKMDKVCKSCSITGARVSETQLISSRKRIPRFFPVCSMQS